MKLKISDIIIVLILIAIVVIARLIPHMPNFAPVGAIALFGGAYLDKRFAIFLPLAAMFISDLFIGFYSPVTMVSVYGSFALVGIIGLWLRKRKTPGNILLAAVGSSVLFFVITNFGVWAAGMYSRGLDGLITSYIMTLPFYRGTLFGDIFYAGVFFGGYEFALRLIKKPQFLFAKSS